MDNINLKPSRERQLEKQSFPKTPRDQEQSRREYAEAWSREWLSQIGLSLLRSGTKPGQPGEPAFRIISTSRLTLEEVCKFTTDLCNADFDSLTVNEKSRSHPWAHTMHKEEGNSIVQY
jgi:hypothetical protein